MTYKEYMRTGEAAAHMGVPGTTLRYWAKRGKIKSIKSPCGWYLFKLEDIEGFLKDTEDTDE